MHHSIIIALTKAFLVYYITTITNIAYMHLWKNWALLLSNVKYEEGLVGTKSRDGLP